MNFTPVTVMKIFTTFLSVILAFAQNYWQNPLSDALVQTGV
jgi:hypothetical protein